MMRFLIASLKKLLKFDLRQSKKKKQYKNKTVILYEYLFNPFGHFRATKINRLKGLVFIIEERVKSSQRCSLLKTNFYRK